MTRIPVSRLLAVATLVATIAVPLQAEAYSSLTVFGDSLSDTGNNALLIGADPGQVITGNSYVPSRPYGANAYSNASTWVTPFAVALGLPAGAVPSLAGGGNYAYGGAETTRDGSSVAVLPGFPPSATTQLLGTGPAYLGGYLNGKSSVPADGLYVIEIGGNDVRDLSLAVATAATPAAGIAPAAAAYADAVGAMVDALQAKGAEHIIVWDTPDIGKTPAALSGGASFAALSSGISSAFNMALGGRLAGEAGVSIYDVFGITDAIVANPSNFGLVNATDACGAIIGCDPSSYLFWDGIHPTSAGQALIAATMLGVAVPVPEPATTALFAVGLVGLIGWQRRRPAFARSRRRVA